MKLELPRRLLLGSALVSLAALLVAVVLAAWRADRDVRQEMQAAMDLATVLQRAHELTMASGPKDNEAAVAHLRDALSERGLRHLQVTLRDGAGRRLWALSDGDPPQGAMRWIVDLHRRWKGQDDPPPLLMQLQRPDGGQWSLVVSPSPDSERRKAVGALMQLLAVLGLGTVLLLVAMGLQIQRLMTPMSRLLQAMSQMRQGRLSAAQYLPPMQLRELQSMADALAELGAALARAEDDRRLLAQRVLTLQEDERRHMAQELHDELGQRLTALRLDASVMQRRLGGAAGTGLAVESGVLSNLEDLAAGLVNQAEQAQHEVRQLLARLAPRAGDSEPVQHLAELLTSLVATRPGQEAPRVHLDCQLGEGDWPTALIMALYRMSQESLTNAWRHAEAEHVVLAVEREGPLIHWSCRDDGRGITDLAQAFRSGNGLAGMRQRAWAFGGDLQVQDAGPGLMLRATLRMDQAT